MNDDPKSARRAAPSLPRMCWRATGAMSGTLSPSTAPRPSRSSLPAPRAPRCSTPTAMRSSTSSPHGGPARMATRIRSSMRRSPSRRAAFEHVMFAGFTHQPAADLAEALANTLPGDLNRVFFSDDGSTAVEVALKIAYQYWINRRRTAAAHAGRVRRRLSRRHARRHVGRARLANVQRRSAT